MSTTQAVVTKVNAEPIGPERTAAISLTVINLLLSLTAIFIGIAYKNSFIYYFAIAPALLFFIAFLALMLQLALKYQRKLNTTNFNDSNHTTINASINVLYRYIWIVSILASVLMIVLAICTTFMGNPEPAIYITLWTFAGLSLIFSIVLVRIAVKQIRQYELKNGMKLSRKNLDLDRAFGVSEANLRRGPPPTLS